MREPPAPSSGGLSQNDKQMSAGWRQADVLVDRRAVEVAVHVRLDNRAVRAVSRVGRGSRDETEDRGAGQCENSGDALHVWDLLPRVDVDTSTTGCTVIPRALGRKIPGGRSIASACDRPQGAARRPGGVSPQPARAG